MTHDVFISHSSHDRDVADAACIALELRGFRCWIAPRDVRPGEDFGSQIHGAILGSRIVLLILSAAMVDSHYVRGEAEIGGQGQLIVFRIADVQPGAALAQILASAHWIDALTPPIAPHLDYLGDTVAQLLDAARRGPLLATAPPGPFPGRGAPNWLPIALAGAAGVVAIALAAAYVGSRGG